MTLFSPVQANASTIIGHHIPQPEWEWGTDNDLMSAEWDAAVSAAYDRHRLRFIDDLSRAGAVMVIPLVVSHEIMAFRWNRFLSWLPNREGAAQHDFVADNVRSFFMLDNLGYAILFDDDVAATAFRLAYNDEIEETGSTYRFMHSDKFLTFRASYVKNFWKRWRKVNRLKEQDSKPHDHLRKGWGKPQ